MALGAYIRAKLTADTAVAAIAGNRVFPLAIPQNESYPAVVYGVQTVPHSNTKTGAADMDKHTVRIQLWGNDYDQLHDLKDAIRACLDYATGSEGGVTVADAEFVSAEDAMDEKNEMFTIQTIYTFKERR